MTVAALRDQLPGRPAGVHRTPEGWRPDSWRELPIEQQPAWPDPAAADEALAAVAARPPLVVPAEIRRLQASLAEVARGDAFLLQAGDCAERFSSCVEQTVRNKYQIIQQMAVLLSYGSGLPVVKVGRIAGQFGKPRSKPTEVVGGEVLPVFRGDIVNDSEPTQEARRPDPARLRSAYDHAAVTLNMLRALATEGGGDLTGLHAWNRDFVGRIPAAVGYEKVIDEISLALRFMQASGVHLPSLQPTHGPDLYTSHEALLLGFEQALTRYDERAESWYATSAHMVWAGDRTRQLDGAHIEYLAGIANPIGVKLGPTMTTADVRELVERLDPHRVPGRLVLISRMGAERVEDFLPPLVEAVRSTGVLPVWACDPMHGNTFVASSGYKTRRFGDITAEVSGFLEVHEDLGTHPGGLHLELTGEQHVTECVGGADDIGDDELSRAYETACDPRLNADQAVELAFHVIAETRRRHHPWFWISDPRRLREVA